MNGIMLGQYLENPQAVGDGRPQGILVDAYGRVITRLNAGGVDLEGDPVSGALVTVGFEHHEIHEGDAYMVSIADTSMANTEVINLGFKTPLLPTRVHMIASFGTLVGAHLEVFEDATWTQGSGSAVAIYNRRRDLAALMNVSEVLENETSANFAALGNAVGNVTKTGGTAIRTLYLFGAANNGGGNTRDVAEIILKPDTQYLFYLTADGNSNAGFIELHWYEHADSN